MNDHGALPPFARPRSLNTWFDEDDELFWDDDPDDAPLCLSRTQQAALATAIGEGLQERGCDNTLRAAQAWTAGVDLDWTAVRTALESRGGYCDCEVLLNVGLAAS